MYRDTKNRSECRLSTITFFFAIFLIHYRAHKCNIWWNFISWKINFQDIIFKIQASFFSLWEKIQETKSTTVQYVKTFLMPWKVVPETTLSRSITLISSLTLVISVKKPFPPELTWMPTEQESTRKSRITNFWMERCINKNVSLKPL